MKSSCLFSALLLCITFSNAPNVLACADVTACGAIGDGITDASAAIQACINAQEQNDLCFPKGTYRLASDIVFRGHLSLQFDAGAKLLADEGVTVTVNCPVEASPHLHFDGDGTYLFNRPIYRVLHADWFPSLQKAIDAVPAVTPGDGGGGDAVIQMSAKTYHENIVIGGPNETKDIRLMGALKYHTGIQGGQTGPAIRVENSRVQFSDFYACNWPGSGYDAIEMIATSIGDGRVSGGLGGSIIERVGVCGAGRDGLSISGGPRYWIKDMTIYNVSRHAITLGTDLTRVSEIVISDLSVRGVADGNYGLNLVNAAMVRATGRIEETTTPVNIEGAGPRIYLDFYGPTRDWEGYRQ